jgi:hypothetical protein
MSDVLDKMMMDNLKADTPFKGTPSDNNFYFDNYVVRPVTEKDRAYLDTLIAADPYHQDRMDADYFLKLQPGEDAWALEDQTGKVLFYFKTQTAVRLSMQFATAETSADKTRNRIALLKGLAWIEAQLRANNFRELLFESDAPELMAMAKRRMGFKETSGLARDIGLALAPDQMRVEPWDATPRISKEGRG